MCTTTTSVASRSPAKIIMVRHFVLKSRRINDIDTAPSHSNCTSFRVASARMCREAGTSMPNSVNIRLMKRTSSAMVAGQRRPLDAR